MAGYHIQPDDVLIHRVQSVAHGAKLSKFQHELFLYDKKILLHVKNRRGRTQHSLVFPLDRIKQVHGKPHAVVGREGQLGTLDVHFQHGVEHFRFLKATDAATFEKRIYETVTGIPLPKTPLIFGSEALTDSVRQTVGAFKSLFGIHPKSADPQTRVAPVKVAGDCVSCGAPLAGFRGRRIVCEYCDTTNLL